MNDTLAKLARGQVAHQRMNYNRLNEIIHLTVMGSNRDMTNGFDSYVIGALGPLLLTLQKGGDNFDLDSTVGHIVKLCYNIMAAEPHREH